jgi:hypothetical protein
VQGHVNDLKQTYYSTLPDKVRVMAEKGSSWITSKRHAHRYPWLAPNHNETRWLIVDVDRPVNPYSIYDAHLPEPNIISANPENGHAQFFWLLAEPVYSWYCQKQTHPYRYFEAINDAFDDKLGGDIDFRRDIAKNPFHERWHTDEIHSNGFELGELADWVDLTKRRKKTEVDDSEGRNSGLFNELRLWAYRNHYVTESVSFDSWNEQVLTRAFALNTFGSPLGASEVRSVAKSVARYVYYKYTPQAHRGRDLELITNDMDITERQRLSAERTNAARKGATEAKVIWAIGQLTKDGKRITASSVARQAGIHRNSLTRYYSHLLR